MTASSASSAHVLGAAGARRRPALRHQRAPASRTAPTLVPLLAELHARPSRATICWRARSGRRAGRADQHGRRRLRRSAGRRSRHAPRPARRGRRDRSPRCARRSCMSETPPAYEPRLAPPRRAHDRDSRRARLGRGRDRPARGGEGRRPALRRSQLSYTPAARVEADNGEGSPNPPTRCRPGTHRSAQRCGADPGPRLLLGRTRSRVRSAALRAAPRTGRQSGSR